MSGVVAFIRRCLAAGMDHETALLAAEQFEAAPPVPTANALRQRRYRAKHKPAEEALQALPVTQVTDVTPVTQKVSPEPLSKNTLPSPPLGGLMVSRVTGGDVMALAEQIRLLQPPKHRRASVFQITRALSPVLRDHPPADVLAACRAYYAEPDQQEQGGKFAVNAARLLDEGRYRDWLPGHDPPAGPVSDAVKARRLQTFADTGEWKASWGPRPEERAA